MADTPQITSPFYIYTLTVASNATQMTTGVFIGNDVPFTWALEKPSNASFCVTATCNVRLLGSIDNVTYNSIGYSQSPNTITSTSKLWETNGTTAGFFICEAAQYVPYVKVQLTATATLQVDFRLIGKPVL